MSRLKGLIFLVFLRWRRCWRVLKAVAASCLCFRFSAGLQWVQRIWRPDEYRDFQLPGRWLCRLLHLQQTPTYKQWAAGERGKRRIILHLRSTLHAPRVHAMLLIAVYMHLRVRWSSQSCKQSFILARRSRVGECTSTRRGCFLKAFIRLQLLSTCVRRTDKNTITLSNKYMHRLWFTLTGEKVNAWLKVHV